MAVTDSTASRVICFHWANACIKQLLEDSLPGKQFVNETEKTLFSVSVSEGKCLMSQSFKYNHFLIVDLLGFSFDYAKNV